MDPPQYSSFSPSSSSPSVVPRRFSPSPTLSYSCGASDLQSAADTFFPSGHAFRRHGLFRSTRRVSRSFLFAFSGSFLALVFLFSFSFPSEGPVERLRAISQPNRPISVRLVAEASSDLSRTPTLEADEPAEDSAEDSADNSTISEDPERAQDHNGRAAAEDVVVPLASAAAVRANRDLRALRRRSGRGRLSKLAKPRAFLSSLVRLEASARTTRHSGQAPQDGARAVSGDSAAQDNARDRPGDAGDRRGDRRDGGVAPVPPADADSHVPAGRNLTTALQRGRALRAEGHGAGRGGTDGGRKRGLANGSVQRLVAQAVRTPAGSIALNLFVSFVVAYVTWRVVRSRVPGWVPGGQGAKAKGDLIAPNEWIDGKPGAAGGAGKGAKEKPSALDDLKARANSLKALNTRVEAIRRGQAHKTTRELQKETRALKQEIEELYPALQRLRAANASMERELASSALGQAGAPPGAANVPPGMLFPGGEKGAQPLVLPLLSTADPVGGSSTYVALPAAPHGAGAAAFFSPQHFRGPEAPSTPPRAAAKPGPAAAVPAAAALPSALEAEIAAMEAEKRLQQAQAEKRALSSKLQAVEGDVGLLRERLRISEGKMSDEVAATGALRQRNEELLEDVQQAHADLRDVQRSYDSVKNYAEDMSKYSDLLEKKVAALEAQLRSQPEARR
ncbi:conserved hypothetical protein [Neospora caninum Liverpool]|uniref:Transmembrane protein n=1 Tax=Neospora caninum (strain Liverpool) TaxID=572307 RepID=F0VCW6_NEOCL|nr:conserved hypothetical protein [Neospora caninum Liverpool]CBZ51481.1 conserved hypothetical protein [Neospora caninum Liverpool]CEL65431.1 TPA: hypothetical protein BN1204_012750 [Neospora caninum Liverpool]|eukprot:XP_003881514.1 conserved hypothetical protein [Neospora caninum Liverpool]